MPSTASDALAPLSQKTRPLLRTGSLTSPLDLSAPQTQTARRFMTLPKRLSVGPTNEGPASSQGSRLLGMKIDVSPSFFGTCFLRVMSGLRWRDTQPRRRTATPLHEVGDIPAGLGTQQTQISIKTQKIKANRNMRDVMKARQRGHHNRTVGTC